ncbi:restriction endonuclease subunit M [Tenacibaculum phage PTm1]|uniref:Type II restriction endonuclease n=2 Tax=Shirahamavirus PTm1 TaxID=2846435 RepID=A0A5S9HXR6_9CAUD|nr:restriction endonuclease subunit M [Tenacibaculum phage PTm1]BBI90671.1 type II restriction endonuclease [Tenacibaculum phage PTm1]BBI90976.1 type II restriction endonuclease [Tenacibaculum phage PTm5]
MSIQIDILENEILEQYPNVLDILLRDYTTKKNIIWATENYEYLGQTYEQTKQILPELITGENGNLIIPRVQKDIVLQLSRVKNMAEVFTPSWVCNAQNNLIDNAWFQKENIFNTEIQLTNGNPYWKVNSNKIIFPKDKTWQDYISDKRLEITCGEAPYITSRYDTTTGIFIPINERIGLLDRKLRVINENVDSENNWLKAVKIAFESTYAFEWQGDSLLLAREAMLFTFIENFKLKFNKEPLLKSIQDIAYIISWNVWQMDGLKGVVPNSCASESTITTNLFGEIVTKNSICLGCNKNEITKHNGSYCIIKDWTKKDSTSNKMGKTIKYIDLLQQ